MQKSTESPSFVAPTVTNSLIIGILLYVVGVILMYSSISSEPTGSMVNMLTFVQAGSCLLSILASILSVKAFAKMEGSELSVGKGAQIGLLSGVILGVVSGVLAMIWNNFIDPELMDSMSGWVVKNTEMMLENMGAQQDVIDQTIDQTVQSFEESKTFVGMLKSTAIATIGYSVVNAIGGAITGKISEK